MELLVSAALVVLMLMMFAVIFQIATASLATQRGIAENDQRARMLVTILHNDIKYRTFRSVVAFDAGELPPVGGDDQANVLSFAQRRGYLYISENDPDDDRDDVLALTVDMPGVVPLFGRAGHVFLDENGNPYQNQPEADGDGNFQNRTASLTTAEVCYFVRGGNLIRRVMLIRRGRGGEEQPQTDDGTTDLFDPTLPTSGTPPTRYPGVFYRDFDYSVYAVTEDDGQGNEILKVKFHGDDSLENVSSAGGAASFFSLGVPKYRFGHDYLTGQPREYVNGPSGPNSVFIGRFIHEETSHDLFTYPFDLNNGNPYDRNLNLTDANRDAVVDQYTGGRRRSEDILMTHVHGFDVKVWDDALGRFVDVGHNMPQGDFYQTPEGTDPTQDQDNNRNQHLANGIVYGPRGPGEPLRNRVFDTWNPDVHIMDDGDDEPDPPPFRPLRDPEGNNNADEFVALPLRALQITVRYYDVSSDQNRTLTLEFSLLD